MQRLLTVICAGIAFFAMTMVMADTAGKSVAQLYAEKAQLGGKQVTIHGKVVRVTNNVMDKNFLHVQDGTGQEGSNDVTVTSQQTAEIGDEVTVTGTVVLDQDFGSGYTYPLIIEQATITKK